MERRSAIIIGAGPAGLGAAYELAKRGVRPLVVEKADRVGGLSRTETYNGYRLDIGGHRFHTRIDPVQQIWSEMIGRDFLKVARLSRIYYDGRFVKYPLNVFDTLRNLGAAESCLVLLSYAKAKLLPPPDEQTFEQWATRRFGARLYQRFFRTYTEKVWGIPCNVLRADWAVQRIGGLSIATAIRNALFGGNGVRSLINEFHYPVLGPGMMWERFEQRVNAGGGQVQLNGEVVQLNHEGGLVRSIRVNQRGQTSQIALDHLISSMPLSQLIARLRPSPPQEVLRAAASLRHRAFILVGLIVNRPHLFADNWLYIHVPTVRVGRIQNYKNWSARMVPDPDRTCLGMEYFCNEGDDLWTMPDAALLELAGRELAALGLARPGEVEGCLVIREPNAYPVYDQDYRANLEVVRGFLATLGNLQTIGRSGMHRYNNQDHSMLTGMLAARNLLGQRHDVWAVNTERSWGEGVSPNR